MALDFSIKGITSDFTQRFLPALQNSLQNLTTSAQRQQGRLAEEMRLSAEQDLARQLTIARAQKTGLTAEQYQNARRGVGLDMTTGNPLPQVSGLGAFNTSGGNTGNGGYDTAGYEQIFNNKKNELNTAIDKYVGELRGEAQGDFDFAIKWINQEHEKALGTNDQKRAEFFEQVADKLEAEIGRIPYDYMQKTEREQQDIANFLRKQAMSEENQVAREGQFAEQNAFSKKLETTQRNEGFNTRGLLGSGIQEKQRLEDEEKRRLFTENPQALAFATERGARDFETELGQLQSARNTQDITTAARRGGLDQEALTQQQTEQSKRLLEQKLAAIRRQEEEQRRNAESIARQEAILTMGA